MKEEDKRDKFDDLFRSKLGDFEVDTMSDDWEMIADRLPRESSFSIYRNLTYWAAAAVIALLMVTGTVYLFDKDEDIQQIVHAIEEKTTALDSQMTEDLKAQEIVVTQNPEEVPVRQPIAKVNTFVERNKKQVDTIGEVEKEGRKSEVEFFNPEETGKIAEPVEDAIVGDEYVDVEPQPFTAERVGLSDEKPVKTKKVKEKESGKWGFGLGGGSLSMGADNVVPQYVTKSTALKAENLEAMNAPSYLSEVRELPKTDIKHKTPVSFGLSVSRSLNDRWSLQTGVNYTYLSSEWETNGNYHGKTHQSLHFVGIPLSATYRIAEWNRFSLYGTAGVMTEINVSGNLTTKLYSGEEKITKIKEDNRMKDWMWSLNARIGVSYPLIKFVSAFAETGVGYYFDNGSEIETIRSERPFNVAFQFGLRLGF